MSNLFFFNALWPGLSVWCGLYVSDYALTIKCARLYKAGVSETIALEGSYEITPYYQRDVDSLRRITPRFLAMLLLGAAFLTVVWMMAKQSLPELYYFALGSSILVQLAVHMRHLRNLVLFRAVIKTGGLRGRIEYSRALILRSSTAEWLSFSGLYLLLFAFTLNWFIAGGALGCLSTAIKHRRLAAKLPKNAESPEVEPLIRQSH